MIDNICARAKSVFYSRWTRRLFYTLLFASLVFTSTLSIAMNESTSSGVLTAFYEFIGISNRTLWLPVSCVISSLMTVVSYTWYPQQYREYHDGSLIYDIVTELLDVARSQILSTDDTGALMAGPDADLKVTLFIVRKKRARMFLQKETCLVFYSRANDNGHKRCKHSFPIEGTYTGIAGKAFSINDAVQAFGLPDLHPDMTPTKTALKNLLKQYAERTYVKFDDLKSEYEAKSSSGRKMPMSLYGLRIRDRDKKILGVVVVDSRMPNIELEQERIVGRLVELLCAPLRRLKS